MSDRLRRLWVLSVAAGFVLCVLPWTPLDPPYAVQAVGALTLSTAYSAALAARTGTSARAAGGLALLLASVALVTQSGILLAGVAVATGAVASVLGVLATTPGARYRNVVGEVVLAATIALVGAFAVAAYDAPLSADRAAYLTLGIALLGAMGLVFRLGAGLQGLGRRGAVAVGAGVVLLFVGLAYTEALSRWGSGDLRTSLADVISFVRDTFGAVPRPTQFLLGFPALAWGVSTRARRRQGWWVSAFGAAGLAVVSTSLLYDGVPLTEALLILGYSLAIGLALGYAVVRADSYLTGNRGRRARRLEEATAHRPEPARFEPLL